MRTIRAFPSVPAVLAILAGQTTVAQVRLMTLDPGHFHAALIQKEMYPQVSKRVAIFAPLGPDLAEHLHRVARFNLRSESPTSWELDVHASADYIDRMLAEKPGNVVVLSGRNLGKIDAIRRSIAAGLNVLADKPWIISSRDLPALEKALDNSDERGVIAYDIMTERYEITSILLKELLQDPGVFGQIVPGTESDPGVYMESVHHIMKLVAGNPNLRPAWFFDTGVQGEGLSDVGTHLADLVQWTLFPARAPDYRNEISVDGAKRWPTPIPAEGFRRVTGEAGFPARWNVTGDRFDYSCNNQVRYTVRGVHVTLDVLWRWEAPPGGSDTYVAVFRGTGARLEIRQGKPENYRPELFVALEKPESRAALEARLATIGRAWPGVSMEDTAGAIRIVIPDRYRVGHEAHFAQVTRRFFEYLQNPKSLPAWEKAAMLAKYFVSTRGVEMGGK